MPRGRRKYEIPDIKIRLRYQWLKPFDLTKKIPTFILYIDQWYHCAIQYLSLYR